MPLYLIQRDVSGWSEADLDSAGIRSKICTRWYEGMRWVHSYYDRARGLTFCIYEAAREDDLRIHAAHAGIPCDVITEVELIDPSVIGAAVSDDEALQLVGPAPTAVAELEAVEGAD